MCFKGSNLRQLLNFAFEIPPIMNDLEPFQKNLTVGNAERVHKPNLNLVQI